MTLKSLRKRLALICVITTGLLLGAMAASLLFLSESQMDRQSQIILQNNLNSILYRLRGSQIVDNAWLAQLETGNRLIVHIEDNGSPLLFPGSWNPRTDREELIAAAQKKALDQFGFAVKEKPLSVIDVNTVSFEVAGNQSDRYQAALAVIPTGNGNWNSITLLHDTSAERFQKRLIRLSFLGLILFALCLLFLFSWWFSGRAIRPIEESHRKQVEFVAAASHELRSPLAVIQASLSAFRECGPRSDSASYPASGSGLDSAPDYPPGSVSDSGLDSAPDYPPGSVSGSGLDSAPDYPPGSVSGSAPEQAWKGESNGWEDGRQTRFLDAANRECRRMARLIDDLLFLASTDARTPPVRQERIEPDTLLIELYDSFEQVARQSGRRLTLLLPEEPLHHAEGDKQRLFQALSVLLDNAIAYTPKNSQIVLRGVQERSALLLSVEDNGPGIPRHLKEKIFDRFYQADPSRSRKSHYGLGLSVAKEIAELHGGSLTITDTPGGGATFTLRLPAPAARQPSQRTGKQPLSGRRHHQQEAKKGN